MATRRRATERTAARGAVEPTEPPRTSIDEQVALVRAEIDRLPSHQRPLILLCDLAGQTHEEAAQSLGIPVGTVKSRLARGRARLRQRLIRRGVGPDLGGMAPWAIGAGSRAPVSAALGRATCRAASPLLISQRAVGPLRATCRALLDPGSLTMPSIDLSRTAPALLLLLAIGAGGGALVLGQQTPRAGGVPAATPPASPPAPPPSQPRDRSEALKELEGTWIRIATDGKIADQVVRMRVRRRASRPEEVVPEGAAMFTFQWGRDGRGDEQSVRIDPTPSPATIDFLTSQPDAPPVLPGIFKVEGDVLTINFQAVTKPRPKGFVVGERGCTLDVYLRDDH